MQHYLPHEIMLAAWGDFSWDFICYDIVSALIGVRTEHTDPESLTPLLQGLFNRWIKLGKTPYTLGMGESGFLLEERGLQCRLGVALQGMRSLLIYGIGGGGGRPDCLYTVFSSKRRFGISTVNAIKILFPCLDIAMGRIPPLSGFFNLVPFPRNSEDYGLSNREIEIMNWIRIGKTNSETAALLGISIFTIKNHLQNVFKKLHAYKCLQAASGAARIPYSES